MGRPGRGRNNRFSLYLNGDLNQIYDSRAVSVSTRNARGVDRIRIGTENSLRPRFVNQGNFWLAQVLESFGPDVPMPPGLLYSYTVDSPDRTQQTQPRTPRVPWIVARVPELMGGAPDPANYNPDELDGARASFEPQLAGVAEALRHYEAIRRHFQFGIFLPEFPSSDYPLPPPGAIVEVSFSNVMALSGGRYRYDESPSTVDHTPSRGAGATSVEAPMSIFGQSPIEELGGEMDIQNQGLPIPEEEAPDQPLYGMPFDDAASDAVRMMSSWGWRGTGCAGREENVRTDGCRPHKGPDLYIPDAPFLGIGTPIVAIGNGIITEITPIDAGSILTLRNFLDFASGGVHDDNGHLYRINDAYADPVPENGMYYVSRKDKAHGSVLVRIPIQIDLSTQRSGPDQVFRPEYGIINPFSNNISANDRQGNVVTYELTSGPREGSKVRNMHLAAFAPALTVGDRVWENKEIGLLGSTCNMNSQPHLHFDFGRSRRSGHHYDPACYIKGLENACDESAGGKDGGYFARIDYYDRRRDL